ncbi:polysaccharide deacetylase family protein [Flectobacillus major]|jgi:peptidoglycan/xylan/chitin deacetylase (PgdA/CDA1 family)|uniref:polysaccharide deacetylase family protein n=1 Tax=Flectobacillus major TaxID=103 RepID=UPI0003FE568D|nr:polysaccharide deacetylase family protein [Flectobacillus major]
MNSRRNFIKKSGLLGLSGMALSTPQEHPRQTQWADGSSLIVSISMQFEAGGQPDNAESPFPQNIQKGYIDLPASTWYEYGYKEGIPRMLDLWDQFGIKVTSHIVGTAALKNPKLAKEIVDRGHEAAAHGLNWATQYTMSYEEEKKFIKDGQEAIQQITGVKALGYNANWLRRGPNTLAILQELGFIYHIDDVSRDQPFIIQVNNQDFAVVPYTIRCNDIVLIEGKNFSAEQFLQQVKMEFDQLYLESKQQRRMLSISFHDRIGGTPQMATAIRNMLTYMQKHKGVVFKRKDEIARMTLSDKNSIRET